MTPRKLRADDIPILQAMQRGFPYPDPCDPMIECIVVMADEKDQPVAAFAAKRLVEIYAWVGDIPTPAKMQALRIAHGCLPGMLRARGYTHAEAFLPPGISGKFGRRLARSFGWVRNWASWGRGL